MKKTILTFKNKKKQSQKISMLTAYDYSIAKIIDNASVDAILVGDSLGMVCLGYPDTLAVTMEDMIHHSRAVARGATNTFIVTDMPFMSYQVSCIDAVKNAGRLIKEGAANAIKLEGGVEICDKIEAIVKASIPVMAHIGLTPQSINTFGGFKVQGKNAAAAKHILEMALAVEKAGAFAVVLECIPKELATLISEQLTIPTIGIGAGVNCDGQILVYQDLLGMYNEFLPKFVKRYANIGDAMECAFKEYISDVENKTFPTEQHSFSIDKKIIEQLKDEIDASRN